MEMTECPFCSHSQVFASSRGNWFEPDALRVDLIFYKNEHTIAAASFCREKSEKTEPFLISYCPLCGKKLNT